MLLIAHFTLSDIPMKTLPFFIVLFQIPTVKYLIHQALLYRLGRTHESVSFRVLRNRLDSLTGMRGQNFI